MNKYLLVTWSKTSKNFASSIIETRFTKEDVVNSYGDIDDLILINIVEL